MTIQASEARRGFALTIAASLRPGTVSGYLGHLDVYLRWCNGNSPYDRKSVLGYLVDVGARCSRPTLATYFKALRAFFAYCAGEGICPDPMQGLRPPRVSLDESERDVPGYTTEDRDALLDACPPWTWLGLRDRALIWSLWALPLRASELCGIRVADIDWETLTIPVQGKSGVKYAPVMTLEMAAAIDRYLRHRPSLEPDEHKGCSAPCVDAVWSTETGHILTPHALRLMLKRMAKRAGIKKSIFPHGFRHRFAYEATTAGMSDVEVAAMMGQRSVRAKHGYARRLLESQAWARYRQRLAG